MLGGLTVLLLFQLVGEIIAQAWSLPVPGPVIGMVLLLVALVVRGSAADPLRDAANAILSHLSILFVPGGVGVMLYLGRIRTEWLPIVLSLAISTTLTLIVTTLVLRAWLRRRAADEGDQP